MMSLNFSINNIPMPQSTDDKSITVAILSNLSLVITITGTIFNLATFLTIFFNQELRKTTSMIYLLYLTVTYTLSLYVWNLDHFLSFNYGIGIEFFNIASCKIFVFIQFFSLESSGFLLSMLSVDRYISVISIPGSFASRLPFRTPKSAHLWSCVIIGLVFILNCHILILNGYYEQTFEKNQTISKLICYKNINGFQLNPLWENVHLILYSLIPFIIMIVFNILLIKKISSIKNSNKGSVIRNIKSILAITFLFLIMTLPSSVSYGFFQQTSPKMVLLLLDDLSFLNNSILFFSFFLTNLKFRKIIFDLFNNLLLNCSKKSNKYSK